MLEFEVTPSVVSYTTVLHAHAREGNIQATEKGLEHIGEKGVEKTF
jgi:pentatricopeptide repeat protein